MFKIHPIRCGWGISYLIESQAGLFLVDSGSPGNAKLILAKMADLGRSDLRLIWTTHAHYDHYGSAQSLREITGAPIGVHPADADSMSNGQSPLGTAHKYGIIYVLAQHMLLSLQNLPVTVPDYTRNHGETLIEFGLEASVLHTPGHTPGHTCLLLSNGIAFAGDLFGSFPKPGVQRLLATDWGKLSASVEMLKATNLLEIYSGHNPKPFPRKELEKMATIEE